MMGRIYGAPRVSFDGMVGEGRIWATEDGCGGGSEMPMWMGEALGWRWELQLQETRTKDEIIRWGGMLLLRWRFFGDWRWRCAKTG